MKLQSTQNIKQVYKLFLQKFGFDNDTSFLVRNKRNFIITFWTNFIVIFNRLARSPILGNFDEQTCHKIIY